MSTTHVADVPLRAYLFHLPVGRPIAPSGDCLHVMDGDGASLCEIVDAEDLVQVSELLWLDVPISRRCGTCRVLMQVYAAGAD
jgi:hypothetical protein